MEIYFPWENEEYLVRKGEETTDSEIADLDGGEPVAQFLASAADGTRTPTDVHEIALEVKSVAEMTDRSTGDVLSEIEACLAAIEQESRDP